MISTLKKINLSFLFVGFLATVCFPVTSIAQSSLSLSITPTLIDIESDPGDIWSSSIKVINSNPFPLAVYGSVVNFEPTGEGGQGIFAPVIDGETKGSTLAEWISLTEESVEIPAFSSAPVNFVVTIPSEAQPGGHFAAILIGTQPPERGSNDTSMQTSQVVSSLFFLNVAGDVLEEGYVRSFSAINSFSSVPQSNFSLRFENVGSVHVQPQGDIVIYNMWGKERGRIPVNYHTSFGNALPNTIRKYDFSWKGTLSLTDIGLYRAEVDLAYGKQDRKFTNADVFFWVLPIKAFFITLGTILTIVLFGMWVVRSYIRRVLTLAGVSPDSIRRTNYNDRVEVSNVSDSLDIRSLSAPVRTGIHDFQVRVSSVHSLIDAIKQFCGFVSQYRKFFFVFAGFLLIVLIVVFVYKSVTKDSPEYSVELSGGVSPVSYNSEEVAFIRNVPAGLSVLNVTNSDYTISVVNVSGKAGVAGEVGSELYDSKFPVSKISSDGDRSTDKTVIVFPHTLQNEALAISDALGGVSVSAKESDVSLITVFVGKDRI